VDSDPASQRLAARLPALAARARILRAVRDHFAAAGFLEVETPSRVPAPGQEVHLDAFAAGAGRFLITSPEYHMKRLVAAGADRIVQVGRAFRAEEQGPQHQPEFTIIEWYRARAPLEAIADDCEALLRAAAVAAGTFPVLPARPGRAPGPPLRLDAPFERTTVAELLARHAGIDLAGDETGDALGDKARAAGVALGTARAFDDVFFQIFLDRVEPHLGRDRPTFVFDWPLPLAALARRKSRPGQAEIADRFELYAGGLELANAFGELTDAEEQRARFIEESALRAARGKTVYPLDEKLLRALPLMPPTSGVALGFDRLVMLALGAAEIRDVIAFADDEV
jgi:lysyl-tRNA synthetase class 2